MKNCFFMAKNYQLVAWTNGEKVKMIPSVQYEALAPYREEIERSIDAIRYGSDQEISQILHISRAYEKYGNALLRCDSISDAFVQFAQAAHRCLICSEEYLTISEEYGYLLCPALSGRFFAMWGKCVALLHQKPELEHLMRITGLANDHELMTRFHKLFYAEKAEAIAAVKAWHFGK